MTQDFLTVAIGGGANVASQATYAASADLGPGFANGEIPASAIFNKMVRQSSAIATMIAQAIVDIAGGNMLDDGNAAVQLANFKRMLLSLGQLNYYTDTGAANAYVITPAPAITAYAAGQTFWMVPTHVNTGASTVNVNALGVKSIVHSDGSALQAGDIPATGLVELVYQAGIGKFVIANFIPAPFNNAANGYMRIPGTPFIVQWGLFSATTGASPGPGLAFYTAVGTLTFPIAFPTASLMVCGSAYDISVRSGEIFHIGSVGGAASVTGYLECDQASTAMTGSYVAIGY